MDLRYVTFLLETLFGVNKLPSKDVCLEGLPDELLKKRISKCLIYNPDAIGRFLIDDFEDVFRDIERKAPIKMKVRSIFPPKTPVCFASMYTGMLPKEHGIRKYEKPILRCQTIFDTLIENQISPAIFAVENSSMDIIFADRKMGYYSGLSDGNVTRRAIRGFSDFDLSVVYHQEYDDTIHKSKPRSLRAISAVHNHINSFLKLADAFNNTWKDEDRLIIFAPDHGVHFDSEIGKGNHGKDIPEDMLLYHFIGYYKAGSTKPEKIDCN